MSYEFYKVLHLLGISLILVPLGGLIMHVMNGGTKASNANRRWVMITHGIGMMLALTGGFGLLARLGGIGFPPWIWGKFAIWLTLGVIVVVINRMPNLSKVLFIAVPFLVALATYLVQIRA